MEYFILIIGACIGSFLNVCIYRLPRGQSIVFPGSHCPNCKVPIRWYDNIPVLSWFILRGKCRDCKHPISFRYPLVELITAILFVIIWNIFPISMAVATMIFISILVVVTFIDLDFLMIPDRLTIGGFLFAIIVSFLIPSIHEQASDNLFLVNSIRSGIVGLKGAFIGSGLLIWIAFLGETFMKEETVGVADIKLMGFIGGFCGSIGAVFAIFGGAILATCVLLPFMVFKKLKTRDPESAYTVIPFGPWLAFAAILYVLWLRDAVDEYVYYVFNAFYG